MPGGGGHVRGSSTLPWRLRYFGIYCACTCAAYLMHARPGRSGLGESEDRVRHVLPVCLYVLAFIRVRACRKVRSCPCVCVGSSLLAAGNEGRVDYFDLRCGTCGIRPHHNSGWLLTTEALQSFKTWRPK